MKMGWLAAKAEMKKREQRKAYIASRYK